MDHHGANGRTNVHHARGCLDGCRLRPSARIDRCVDRLCGYLTADALFGKSVDALSDAVSGRTCLGLFYPAYIEFHTAEYAPKVLGFRHRGLRTQSRAVAQHIGLSGGLVRRASLLAVDLLAKCTAGADHVAVSAPWYCQ